MTQTLSTARLLLASSVASIPVKADKTPLLASWSKYRKDLPTDAELERWFAKGAAIALIAGKVQCLDFDEKYSAGIFARYCKRAEEVGLDQLIGQLILQKTPSGGFHLVWQCDGERIGNLKLAQKANLETLIETRGDGGYFLISPSDNYTLMTGDWSSIPAITADDRDALLTLAKTFDEQPVTEAHPEPAKPAGQPSADATPGDDFDFRADVPSLLKQHGWKPAGASGKYWTRPGKTRGISASWDVVPGRFFVFSSSTEFTPNHVYRPWHVYAMLECSGDYSRAASELRRQGFGGVAPKKTAITADQWAQVGEPPAIETTPGEPPQIDGIDPAGEAPTIETEDEKIRRLLRARAFDPSKTPPPIRPIFTLGGVVICTPGNITAITAQAKVGKSAFVSAMIAAAMAEPDADCLSVTGLNPHGKAFVFFDTEQAPDDFWWAVRRAMTRAGVEEKPTWLRCYTIADFPVNMGRKAVMLDMADASEAHNGLHAVIIDGAADLVLDVNDAEECNGLVSELHRAAIRHDCPIICVVHKNPGSDKTRGHLGSQIERKAETNLTLEKEDEITVIWSVKQRRAPIDKKTGPRFKWDDEMKMHATVVDDGATPLTNKVFDLRALAVEAFNGATSMRYKAISEAIAKARDLSAATSNRKISEMCKSLVLVQDKTGNYTINPNV